MTLTTVAHDPPRGVEQRGQRGVTNGRRLILPRRLTSMFAAWFPGVNDDSLG
jgi:hypothetical protein